VRKTNLGQPIEPVFDAVDGQDLREVGKVIWTSTRHHLGDASCECPAIEAIARLQVLGYTITKTTPP
jgi:hypothetical protein